MKFIKMSRCPVLILRILFKTDKSVWTPTGTGTPEVHIKNLPFLNENNANEFLGVGSGITIKK